MLMEKIKINIDIPKDTPLVEYSGLFGINKILVKDESCHPTSTFKDRLGYKMIQPLVKAIERGEKPPKTTFCSISYGNTALSMGYYCKKLNEAYGENVANSIVIVPPNLSNKILGPNTKGDYIKGSDLLDELRKYCHCIEYNLDERVLSSIDIIDIVKTHSDSFENIVDVTEGIDVPAYEPIISEVIENQVLDIPDYIIVPFGAGILCNEVKDYVSKNKLNSKVIPVSTGNPESIATMLYGPIWVDTTTLFNEGSALSRHNPIDKKGNLRSPYEVFHIDDYEILQAIPELKKHSISSEPSAIAGFAILNRLSYIDSDFDPQKHSVLVINTGNGILNYDNLTFTSEHSHKTNLIIDDDVESYVNKCNNREDYYDLELYRKMHPLLEDDILQITTLQSNFLTYLVKTFNPKEILDIGTYKGFSAFTLAQSSGEDAMITTIEKTKSIANEAMLFFHSQRILEKINLIVDDGVSALRALIKQGKTQCFDFILLDADKVQYVEYYNHSVELLRPGGILAIDNTLFFGTVVGKKVEDDELTKYVSEQGTLAIQKMNNLIRKDSRVFSCMLPISDGFTLITKK